MYFCEMKACQAYFYLSEMHGYHHDYITGVSSLVNIVNYVLLNAFDELSNGIS